MKQSDIITIIGVAALGVLISYFSLNALLSNPDEAEVSFMTVNAISSDLSEPSADIFNSAAINPTVEVYVGGCVDSNQNGVLDDEEQAICGNNVIDLNDKEEEDSEDEDSEETDTSEDSESDEDSEDLEDLEESSDTDDSSIESEGE